MRICMCTIYRYINMYMYTKRRSCHRSWRSPALPPSELSSVEREGCSRESRGQSARFIGPADCNHYNRAPRTSRSKTPCPRTSQRNPSRGLGAHHPPRSSG